MYSTNRAGKTRHGRVDHTMMSKERQGEGILPTATSTEKAADIVGGKAPKLVLTEDEKDKCRELAKKIVEEDRRLGAKPLYGSNNPETLLQANYRGLCAELAISRLYPGSIPEVFKMDFSKPHFIGGPDIIVRSGSTIQVKSTWVYPQSQIQVNPCRVGPEKSWRFCDCTYVVYYRDSDMQIVTSILLADLRKCPESGFGRLLELPYEKYWKGRIER